MGIGASIFLIAVGAVLTWAVEVATPGIDLDVVGMVLMGVGAFGLALSLLYREEMWPFGTTDRIVEREYVDRVDGGSSGSEGLVRERRTVRRRQERI